MASLEGWGSAIELHPRGRRGRDDCTGHSGPATRGPGTRGGPSIQRPHSGPGCGDAGGEHRRRARRRGRPGLSRDPVPAAAAEASPRLHQGVPRAVRDGAGGDLGRPSGTNHPLSVWSKSQQAFVTPRRAGGGRPLTSVTLWLWRHSLTTCRLTPAIWWFSAPKRAPEPPGHGSRRATSAAPGPISASSRESTRYDG